MSRHVFCRDVCLERGEPLAGTGKMAQRHLLVRWPRGKWRVPRFESADMSPDLREAIRLAMQSGAHVALVDRVGQTGTIPQLQSDGVAANYESEAEMVAAITRWTAGEPLVGTPDTRIIILCCTDSRRDACCARYGFATYKALAEAVDPARFNLLQSTHVGGCRFAASLVVLPQRQRYGRVGPEDATAFLVLHRRGSDLSARFPWPRRSRRTRTGHRTGGAAMGRRPWLWAGRCSGCPHSRARDSIRWRPAECCRQRRR